VLGKQRIIYLSAANAAYTQHRPTGREEEAAGGVAMWWRSAKSEVDRPFRSNFAIVCSLLFATLQLQLQLHLHLRICVYLPGRCTGRSTYLCEFRLVSGVSVWARASVCAANCACVRGPLQLQFFAPTSSSSSLPRSVPRRVVPLPAAISILRLVSLYPVYIQIQPGALTLAHSPPQYVKPPSRGTG